MKFVANEAVLKAEIVWVMKLIVSHSSYKSFKNVAEVFKLIFPDSDICKKNTLSCSKIAYLIANRLSPFYIYIYI